MDILSLIGRQNKLFEADVRKHEALLTELIKSSRFLVVGGAGSIGQAVTREIFKRGPRMLHVVDINENNLVELVRDIRSTFGYIEGKFRTFAIDCGSREFDALLANDSGYDYVLNLSALKHVRSEKDPYTLMRMIEVNVLNTIKMVERASGFGARKYFCVSTDKAANPVNLMGASKRVMEMFMMRASKRIPISTSRFANVAFSDGSLLHGFNQRFIKRQPISAPNDVRRYFVTSEESGQLCLMSCLLGDNRDIFFPKLSETLDQMRFSDIAVRYLDALGFEAYECSSEEEARRRVKELIAQKRWPCYFFTSDTTGEKDYEEFFTDRETLDMGRFIGIGIIKNPPTYDEMKLSSFLSMLEAIRNQPTWEKSQILELFNYMIPDFMHKETGKYLDEKM